MPHSLVLVVAVRWSLLFRFHCRQAGGIFYSKSEADRIGKAYREVFSLIEHKEVGRLLKGNSWE